MTQKKRHWNNLSRARHFIKEFFNDGYMIASTADGPVPITVMACRACLEQQGSGHKEDCRIGIEISFIKEEMARLEAEMNRDPYE